MSEWVEEKDWSKVKVGQRVRVERLNGDEAVFIVARIARIDAASLDSETNYYPRDDGWTLFVTPPPTPELPTEPGIYVTNDEDYYWEKVVLFLYPTGVWQFADGFPAKQTAELWHAEAGLTRLVPEADTARKVLDRVREQFAPTGLLSLAGLAEVAAEFGVTEP